MKFDLIISNIMIGILVICSAFALMFVFYIQRKLTPEQYFSFSEFFLIGRGLNIKKILNRMILIVSFNCILFLILKNFFKIELVCSMCILSTLLGSILIIYPAFKIRHDLPNNEMKSLLNYMYVSFVFLALIISILTVFTLVVLFDDISIVTLWQEHKSGIILYLLLVIPSLFFNPTNYEKKMEYAIEKHHESEKEIKETLIKNNNETIIPDESQSSSPFKIKKVFRLLNRIMKDD
ncbi:TPA: hypothetical protein PI901_000798 [Staphylococcus aureus]|nr:hypothetical protein [Staphylococcus aureus]